MKRLRELDRESNGDVVDINMSPLIDMVFLLLIFFMVTSVFVRPSAVALESPKASTAKAIDGNILSFSVDQFNNILHEDKVINLDAVKALTLREVISGKKSVLIIPDKRLSSGELLAIVDACRMVGAESVNVAAKKVD